MNSGLNRGLSRFRLNSLRSRLMLLVALAMMPLAIMTVLAGVRERHHTVQASEEHLRRLTAMAAANEAQSIQGARQILVDLASVPDLMGDTARCTALLSDVLDRNEGYVNFGLIQLNGDVTCSAVPLLHPVNLGDRSHFRRAMEERRFIAGDYVFGRVIKKHTINLTYPVIDRAGKVLAVVFAAMDLEALDTFINDIDLPPGSILTTFDARGGIISRRPEPETWLGKPVPKAMLEAMKAPAASAGAVTLHGRDGIERLHSFARVGTPALTDYTVTIGIPTEGILRAARHDQIMSLLGLGATILLALLAAWLVGDVLIVRRVHKLMGTAERIAAGDLEARSRIDYGNEEIGSLAQALDRMAAALQKKEAARSLAERELRSADQRKDEFLAMLAHELRNPLAPISTGANLLRLLHSENAQIHQTCSIIVRQVQHMTSLVDDLLDVSRVTRGLVSISAQPLDLKRVIEDAVEQIRPLVTARRHRLLVELPDPARAPAPAMGDHKRLVQVVANMLGNAGKYTPEGGTIRLRLEGEGDAGQGSWLLSVSDNGIGMDAGLVGHVFDLFTQAERTPDRSQGGLGLGLALVKSLVELHGGSVQAASPGPGQGSTFTVRLPRQMPGLAAPAAQADADAAGAPAAVTSAPLRILLCDDHVDAVHTLQLFLRSAGHEVDIAYTAGDALELARLTRPDVCLLDIGLPDFDGNELARRLRQLPQAAGSTLIAMTGYGRQQDRATALAAGFDHYLVKPVDTVRLAEILAAVAPAGAPADDNM
ncbi:ATP-binding protein [Herbaspirillum sp. SJZ107]|uniref:hybrid sensor histidine kinase/response regulator n=1 Tax=Herbaspirillum sp. SJZ107 TaxID=2572881 RepID=UPI001170C7FC|nr:ATP-binding protein [Herbaspirillum sp. SJZ107]TQK03212.1 signal transduction histidine kinase [Herbaspirillum sp. SJZ107]